MIRSCSPTSVLARATRLAWPPDSSSVGRSSRGCTPSDVATAATSHESPRYSATVPGGSVGSWSSRGNTNASAEPNHTAVGLIGSVEQSHQRRLPRTVDADESDAIATMHRDGEVGEQHLVGLGEADTLSVNADHRSHATAGRCGTRPKRGSAPGAKAGRTGQQQNRRLGGAGFSRGREGSDQLVRQSCPTGRRSARRLPRR